MMCCRNCSVSVITLSLSPQASPSEAALVIHPSAHLPDPARGPPAHPPHTTVSEDDRVCLQTMIPGSERAAPAARQLQQSASNRFRVPLRMGSTRGSRDGHQAPGFSVPKFAIRAGPREIIYHNPKVSRGGRGLVQHRGLLALYAQRAAPRQQHAPSFPSPPPRPPPRRPQVVNIAVVTCGLLCPGLNDVVRALVHKVRGGGATPTHSLPSRPPPLVGCLLACLPRAREVALAYHTRTLLPCHPPRTRPMTMVSRRATSLAFALGSRAFTIAPPSPSC